MRLARARARLYLNGQPVGVVVRQSQTSSWSFGRFRPVSAFAPFAPLFGLWSLVMHADGETEKLSEAAADELRGIESQLDGLVAALYWPDKDNWTHAGEINIDGNLVEWREV